MEEETKRRLSSGGGAAATAITIALYQKGVFGADLFAIQVTGALIGVSWAPFLYRIDAIERVSGFISVPLLLAWMGSCFLPAFYALIIDLFTGHRHIGAQWWEGVWRIYAIMALWMLIAVLNERVVRPYWKKNFHNWFGRSNSNSVVVQANQIAIDKREAAFNEIRARVSTVKRKKRIAQKAMEEKKLQIAKAKEHIEKVELMLQKATQRAELDSENVEAAEEVAALKVMLENARLQDDVLHTEVERLEIDVEETAAQIVQLQAEWREALPLEKYKNFYR